MTFDSYTVYEEHIKAGKVRVLGVTSKARMGALPQVSTIAESGLKGYDVSNWLGVLAPAGTPKDVVAKLNGAMNAALKQDDVRARLGASGIEIQGGTPADFAKVIQAEVDKWGRIVKEAGIPPE